MTDGRQRKVEVFSVSKNIPDFRSTIESATIRWLLDGPIVDLLILRCERKVKKMYAGTNEKKLEKSHTPSLMVVFGPMMLGIVRLWIDR